MASLYELNWLIHSKPSEKSLEMNALNSYQDVREK